MNHLYVNLPRTVSPNSLLAQLILVDKPRRGLRSNPLLPLFRGGVTGTVFLPHDLDLFYTFQVHPHSMSKFPFYSVLMP